MNCLDENLLTTLVPEYRGLEWQEINLPTAVEAWAPQHKLALEYPVTEDPEERQSVEHYFKEPNWRWPKKEIAVFTDLHADADAFVSSLVASGHVKKTGPMDEDIQLTNSGKQVRFVICGDCFDKGPSNLRLLRAIKSLKDIGGKVKILAGNHDIRFLIGIRALDDHSDPLLSHLFLRMAPKGVRFIKEIYDSYVAAESSKKRRKLGENLSPKEVRERLFPPAEWEEQFTEQAQGVLKEKTINKEKKRAREKQQRFEKLCTRAGLTLGMAYAAVMKWRELFLSSNGEFAWFFKEMELAYGTGSFLFVHAGVDDVIAESIRENGLKYINQQFHRALENSLFKLYYGSLGNVFRTKYRASDGILSVDGAHALRNAGYDAIVHGHINRLQGQQIDVRQDIIHFECDATLDLNSRIKEGLEGRGAATTLFKPEGYVLGISVDYHSIKCFMPASTELEMQRDEAS